MIYTGDLCIPQIANQLDDYVHLVSQSVDAADEKLGIVLKAPRSGTISKIYVGIYLTSVAPTGDYDIRLETVSGQDPSGTLLGTNSNGALTIIGADDVVFREVSLTTPVDVRQGDLFALVYVPPATPGSVFFPFNGDAAYGFPYNVFHNGTAWNPTTGVLSFALEYSDGDTPQILSVMPFVNMAWLLYNEDSTYTHYGTQFTPKYDLEIIGCWSFVDMNGTVVDATIKLISGVATVERSGTIYKEVTGGATVTPTSRLLHFSEPFTVLAGTTYKLVAYTSVTGGTTNSLGMHFLDILDGKFTLWTYGDLFSEFSRVYGDLSTWTPETDRLSSIGPVVRIIG